MKKTGFFLTATVLLTVICGLRPAFGEIHYQSCSMLAELNDLLEDLITHFTEAYDRKITWFIAGEYAMTDVNHVVFPNRILREAGLLKVAENHRDKLVPIRSVTRDYEIFDGELPDMSQSRAFAVVDHQLAHVYVPDGDRAVIRRIAELFEGREGIAEVLDGDQLAEYGLNHPRCGDLVLVSEPNSWMQYYWWLDDALAPDFARRVDIHQKPGYDPCEQFFDLATKSIPLDVSRVKASHGAPVRDASQKTIFLCSDAQFVPQRELRDIDVYELIMQAAWR